MFQAEHAFNETHDSGSRVEMAQVSLDGAERAPVGALRALGEYLAERPDFNQRPQLCARPMSLDVTDPGPDVTPATAWASAITDAWPSILGAMKPTFLEPSLLMALPRITARM